MRQGGHGRGRGKAFEWTESRERRLIEMRKREYTRREIAASLGVSEAVVRAKIAAMAKEKEAGR